MKWVTTAAAVDVAATGLLLILSPVLFGRLILGDELSEPGQALGRITGIALVSLALTSWPDPPMRSVTQAIFIGNLLLTIYLGYLGLVGKSVGVLLWPAVDVHLLLTVLFAADHVAVRRA